MERFKSDGIKTILAGAVLPRRSALAKTSYRPRLVATSEGVLASSVNPPGSDRRREGRPTGNVGYPFNDPVCRMPRSGHEGHGRHDRRNRPAGDRLPHLRRIACRYVALFAALAKAAGKNPTAASFGKAAEKPGSIEIPGSGRSPTTRRPTPSCSRSTFSVRPGDEGDRERHEPVGANASTAK